MSQALSADIDKLVKAMAELSGDLKLAIAADIVPETAPDGISVELIPDDEAVTVSQSFTLDQVDAVDVSNPTIYSGRPTDKDLSVINSLVGRNSAAEEWSVYCYRASDNFFARATNRHGIREC